MGKLNVYQPDDKSMWDWAIFHKNDTIWKAHGESVVRALLFLPSSFRRVPWDPAKKIHTGYKAWEFQQYIYGLGPTLFHHLLPCKYWLNFCKLMASIHILQCHAITYNDLLQGHNLLVKFACEFEDLYYQCMESQVHFIQQSIHLLTHMGPETFWIGPLACYAQWTLETAIGNFGHKIHQDWDLYANLTQRTIIQAQINALCAHFPWTKLQMGCGSTHSAHAREFDGGYAFLPCCEEFPSPKPEDELEALMVYWGEQGWLNADAWSCVICRWAKLQPPMDRRLARCGLSPP